MGVVGDCVTGLMMLLVGTRRATRASAGEPTIEIIVSCGGTLSDAGVVTGTHLVVLLMRTSVDTASTRRLVPRDSGILLHSPVVRHGPRLTSLRSRFETAALEQV